MRVKRVNRYYCEFCKKAGCSGYHMTRHEASCTLNPNRVCRLCTRIENEPTDLAAAIALLPVPTLHELQEHGATFYGDSLYKAVAAALPALREATGNCPVCIMAALRQRGIPVPLAEGFDYAKELKSIWETVNDDARQDRY